MFAIGITIGGLIIIAYAYNAWVDHLKKRSANMNVLVTSFPIWQVFFLSIWPFSAFLLLWISIEPASITPSENLASLFYLGPIVLITGFISNQLAFRSPIKSINYVFWLINVYSCFLMLLAWAFSTFVVHHGVGIGQSNDFLWAYGAIDYDVAKNTYNPETLTEPVIYFVGLLIFNLIMIFFSTKNYEGTFGEYVGSILQGLGIYQIIIIFAMITDNSNLLLKLGNALRLD